MAKTVDKYWRNKNIFITGCTGLLGSWLTKSLTEKGGNVVGLVRDLVPKSNLHWSGFDERLTVVRGCLEDYGVIERTFNEYEIDTCFHLGAQTIVEIANRSPLSTFESNIKGTWNVLEAARNSPLLERLVVASSDKAYGSHKELPYKEDACLRGLHPYDVSKTCTDLLAQTYFNTYGLPVGITRCGNFYGGGDLNFNRIVPGTIRSILLNERPIIRSDGTLIRDYIYVLEAVEAYTTLAENLDRRDIKGEAFNFGTETPISVIDLVNKILSVCGRKDLKPKILGGGEKEIKHQYLSCEKARRLLNWRPKYTLEQGLKETFRWYKAYLKDMGQI